MPNNKVPMLPHEIDEFVAKLRANGQLINDRANHPRPPVGGGLIAKKRGSGQKKLPVKLVPAEFHQGFNSLTYTLPLKLEPVTNGGSFKKWMLGQAGRHRRVVASAIVKNLREFVFIAEAAQAGTPVFCLITRLGHSMDSDGLQGAAKWVRDAVAMFCGVDDGLKGPIQWLYTQERRAFSGVKVRLSLDAPPTTNESVSG